MKSFNIETNDLSVAEKFNEKLQQFERLAYRRIKFEEKYREMRIREKPGENFKTTILSAIICA